MFLSHAPTDVDVDVDVDILTDSAVNLSLSSCRFVVTGFGPFRGVPDNPTSVLSRRLPVAGTGQSVVESQVMETSMMTVRADVGGIYERLLSSARIDRGIVGLGDAAEGDGGGHVDDAVAIPTAVVLHLGVDYNATQFKLERCAYNDATFRVPDERGCMPNNECISLLRDDGGGESLSHDWGRCVETTLDLNDLCDRLRMSQDEAVMVSADPGRFVCNYTYYLSLNRCRSINDELLRTGTKCDETGRGDEAMHRHHALFVHVPPFDVVPEGRQLDFILRVMEAIERQLDAGR
jgi:pyroglutamyl-peptidase